MGDTSSEKQPSNKKDGNNSKKNGIRYKLVDERRYNFLTIQDLLTGEIIRIHALELVKNKAMIKGFGSWEARHIGVIAGHACFEPPPPTNSCE